MSISVLPVFVPILMMVIGLLLYIVASNPKLQELGRLTFAAGAFAFGFSVRT